MDPRLAQLGFTERDIDGVHVIIPPVCDVPAGEFLMGSDPTKNKPPLVNFRVV